MHVDTNPFATHTLTTAAQDVGIIDALRTELSKCNDTIERYRNAEEGMTEALNHHTWRAIELEGSLEAIRSHLGRSSTIEAISRDIVHWYRATDPHQRGAIAELVGRLEAVLPPSVDAPSISPMGETSRRCDADDLATTVDSCAACPKCGSPPLRCVLNCNECGAVWNPSPTPGQFFIELREMMRRQAKENESLKGDVQTLRCRQAREDWVDGRHKPLTVCLNRLVEVKLTPTGQTSLAHYNAQAIVSFVSFQGVLRAHLRDVICIFGEALNRSHLAEPFEGNSITLLPEED